MLDALVCAFCYSDYVVSLSGACSRSADQLVSTQPLRLTCATYAGHDSVSSERDPQLTEVLTGLRAARRQDQIGELGALLRAKEAELARLHSQLSASPGGGAGELPLAPMDGTGEVRTTIDV